MIDREKAIKGLTAHRNGNCNERDCPWFHAENDTCMVNLLDATLDLLKEQDTTRPVYTGRFWACEKCGEMYQDILEVMKYRHCPWCGRRFEW